MNYAKFTALLKKNPGRKWRQTGGPPFPAEGKKKARRAGKPQTGPSQFGRQGFITAIELLLPLKTVSEPNQRDNWRAKHRRNQAQQEEVKIEWMRLAKGVRINLPCAVKLTRIGPRLLDDDNLSGAFKHVRDAIADVLGVDDGSSLVRFEYDQVIEPERQYAVKIEIRSLMT